MTAHKPSAGSPGPVVVALAGMAALAAALGVGRFVYTPILPVMAAALHLSKSEAGLIASANFAGYLVGALAATLPLFGGRRRLWLLAGLAVNAAALLAMGAVDGIVPFALIRFFAGWASGFVMVFGTAIVVGAVTEAGRPGLSSLHFAGPGTGIATSAVLVAGLAAAGVGWPGLWLANGLLALVALILVAAIIPADRPAVLAGAATVVPARLGSAFYLLTVAYGLVGFGYVITSTFIVTLVRETPEIARLESWVWVVVGLSAAPSAALWAAWARRRGVMLAFAHAAIAEAIGVAASVLWPSLPGILLAAILLGGTFIGLTALGLVAARGMVAGDPRRGIAILTAAFGLGQIIGPSLAGRLHDLTGSFTEVTYIAAAALMVSAALALQAHRAAARDN